MAKNHLMTASKLDLIANNARFMYGQLMINGPTIELTMADEHVVNVVCDVSLTTIKGNNVF